MKIENKKDDNRNDQNYQIEIDEGDEICGNMGAIEGGK